MDQQLCLQCNNYPTNLTDVLYSLMQRGMLCDVTLACEGETLRAHQNILSACSSYFETIFVQNSHTHPIIFLKDVSYNEMKALLDFMYKGEVNISKKLLPIFLKTAKALQIRGITDSNSKTRNDDLMDEEQDSPPREKRKEKSSSYHSCMDGSVSVHPEELKVMGGHNMSDIPETDLPPIPPPEATDTIDGSSEEQVKAVRSKKKMFINPVAVKFASKSCSSSIIDTSLTEYVTNRLQKKPLELDSSSDSGVGLSNKRKPVIISDSESEHSKRCFKKIRFNGNVEIAPLASSTCVEDDYGSTNVTHLTSIGDPKPTNKNNKTNLRERQKQPDGEIKIAKGDPKKLGKIFCVICSKIFFHSFKDHLKGHANDIIKNCRNRLRDDKSSSIK